MPPGALTTCLNDHHPTSPCAGDGDLLRGTMVSGMCQPEFV